MTWVAAGTAAAGIASSVIGSRSAKKAAQQQQQAAARGQEQARGIYDQTRGDTASYRALGDQSSNQLMQLLQGGDLTRGFTNADFEKDPGYEWRLQEGKRALEGSAAARGGGGLGGATLKALEKYGQGYASNEFDRAANRFSSNQDRTYAKLLGGTGVGLQGTSQAGAAGANYGNQALGLTTGAGNAAAAGTVGAGNAWQSGLGTVANGLQESALLRTLQGGYQGGNIRRRTPPTPTEMSPNWGTGGGD